VVEFRYSNIEREKEAYGYDGVVKSHCRMCHGGCGVIVYLKQGGWRRSLAIPTAPSTMGPCAARDWPRPGWLTTPTA